MGQTERECHHPEDSSLVDKVVEKLMAAKAPPECQGEKVSRLVLWPHLLRCGL